MKRESAALDELVEEVALLLEATVRVEEGIFHLTVPISANDDEEDDEAGGEEEDEPDFQVTVALSVSEDGATIFATRRLCGYDESIDLESLLRDVGGTIHVQLSIDEDDDVVLGAAAPITAGSEWIADVVGEIAELAPELAEDAAPVEDDG